MATFQQMLDDLFGSALGTDATFQHGTATPVAVRAMWREPDTDVGLYQTGATLRHRMADVRVTQVGTASEGDLLVVAGSTYAVAKAMRPDPDSLLWRLEVVPGTTV